MSIFFVVESFDQSFKAYPQLLDNLLGRVREAKGVITERTVLEKTGVNKGACQNLTFQNHVHVDR